MNSKSIIILLFLALAASGACSGYFASHDRATPKPLELLFLLVSTVLVYLWYYKDAASRGYRRTPLMGGAVIMLAVLAIPVYLFRSRPSGQKLRAVLGYLGLLVLALLTLMLAGLPFELAAVGAAR